MKVSVEDYKKLVKKKPKYRNKAGVYKGTYFHSAAEEKRYQELLFMEHAGGISNLRWQSRWLLFVAPIGSKYYTQVGTYVSDFDYFEFGHEKQVVEDVKGFMTPLAKWKIKHFKAQYPEIEFRIVKEERKKKGR